MLATDLGLKPTWAWKRWIKVLRLQARSRLSAPIERAPRLACRLLLDDASGCGLSTRVAADAEEAYFVVHHSCASITISIAHEIGHILGARHYRAIDANNVPFAYGHGYVNGKWRDIMSYQQSCDGCVRIPYWSNPRVTYKGEPTGTMSEDTARVILEQAERVSKFR